MNVHDIFMTSWPFILRQALAIFIPVEIRDSSLERKWERTIKIQAAQAAVWHYIRGFVAQSILVS